MALCALGSAVSARQVETLGSALRGKCAVLLLRKVDLKLTAIRSLREAADSALPGRLLEVEVPPGVPGGSKGRKELRQLVAQKAEEKGFPVSFEKAK
jgi:hypothetical protein